MGSGALAARELEAAGLYDPAAPDARQRLALLEYLAGMGASVEQLLAYRDELPALASLLVLWPGHERLTLAEVAARAGVEVELARRTFRAAGFPDPGADARIFSEADVEVLETFRTGALLFGDDATLQLARVIGSAMARVADAAISAFLVNLEVPILAGGVDLLAVARANADAAAMVPQVARLMDLLLRRHIEAARRPVTSLVPGLAGVDTQQLAVGFADLVGSTVLARQLPHAELAAAFADFDATASDVVVGAGGRVVKLIGDEVMFVAPDATAACETALRLAEAFEVHPVLPPVRGAVAVGDVVLRDGDYFGPVVNLAARAVKLARPSEVVVSTEIAERATGEPGRFSFETAGAHRLKGFDGKLALLRVRRAIGPGVDG